MTGSPPPGAADGQPGPAGGVLAAAGGPLAALLDEAAAGRFPPPDGSVTVLPQPSPRDAGVISFTAHSVIFTDADPVWVRAQLPPGDLSGPLLPEFLQEICTRTGRRVNNIDLLCVTAPLPGPPPLALAPLALAPPAPNPLALAPPAANPLALAPPAANPLALAPPAAHPLGPAAPAPPAQTPLPLVTGTMARLARALRYRDDVRAWKVPGGILVLGRGVAGRWEVSLEVEPEYRGQGLGRELALAARHLVPGDAPLWAQIAPGNAASVRAFLAAGYRPAGAEALLPLA